MNIDNIITDEKVKNFFLERKTIILVVAGILVAGGIFLGTRGFIKHRQKQNRTEITQKTIKEIKEIKEFCTANYLGEVMMQEKESKYKELILIVRGKIRAGFDLSKMETSTVGDSIIILKIPHAKILDIITNPSDIRTFVEKGKWSPERATIVKNNARQKLLELVMKDNILGSAEDYGEKQLTSIFTAFGFKEVRIEYLDTPVTPDSEEYKELVGDTSRVKK